MNTIAREAELRRNVVDRLIMASLRDAVPAREVVLQRWRGLQTARSELGGKPESPTA